MIQQQDIDDFAEFNKHWQILDNKKLGEIHAGDMFTFKDSMGAVFKVTTDMMNSKTVEIIAKKGWEQFKYVLPDFIEISTVTRKQ